ncbi:hypothetical protein HZA86_00775 [Candidatus Uhrbacteria bacterium]|nr:hypothetical protein [Candidatus Uhrbacteria bacterium]
MKSFFWKSWLAPVASIALILTAAIPVTTRLGVAQQSVMAAIIIGAASASLAVGRLAGSSVVASLATSIVGISGSWAWLLFSSNAGERFFRLSVITALVFALFQWFSILVNSPVRAHRELLYGQWLRCLAVISMFAWSAATWAAPSVFGFIELPTILLLSSFVLAAVILICLMVVARIDHSNVLLTVALGGAIGGMLLWLPAADAVRFLLMITIVSYYTSSTAKEP